MIVNMPGYTVGPHVLPGLLTTVIANTVAGAWLAARPAGAAKALVHGAPEPGPSSRAAHRPRPAAFDADESLDLPLVWIFKEALHVLYCCA